MPVRISFQITAQYDDYWKNLWVLSKLEKFNSKNSKIFCRWTKKYFVKYLFRFIVKNIDLNTSGSIFFFLFKFLLQILSACNISKNEMKCPSLILKNGNNICFTKKKVRTDWFLDESLVFNIFIGFKSNITMLKMKKHYYILPKLRW